MSSYPNDIAQAATGLVERLYLAATVQAMQYGWRSFSFKFGLHIGEWSPLSVVVKKDNPVEPTLMCVDGAEFPLHCEAGRWAAAVLLMQAVWPNRDETMADVEDDPATVKDDYGLQWLWAGYSGQNVNGRSKQATTMYKAGVEPSSVPAVGRLVARLEDARFRLEEHALAVLMRKVWTEGEGTTVTYGFQSTLKFFKGSARLVVRVQSDWLPTLPEAVETATAVTETIWHRGDLVPIGKGQLNKCKAIGRELWQTYGHLVDAPRPGIVVPYETRGGRGGWKVKVAQRTFSPRDLANAPDKTKPRLPGIRVVLELEASNGWGKAGQRFVRLREDGQVDVRHSVFKVQVEDDWAFLCGSRIRYRMPVMEWTRLQVKAKLQ